MQTIIVVNNPKDWPLALHGVEVVPAKEYLMESKYSASKGPLVFNLCRSYRYQSLGYYVSLLAAARGHRPLPSIPTILDMKSLTMIRYASEDLEDLIQHSLKPLRSRSFTLSVYFGRNLAKHYDRLSRNVFNLFQAPLLRAHFEHDEEKWQLQRVAPIGAKEIPQEHWDFVIEAAKSYFSKPRYRVRKAPASRYDIAILHNPTEVMAPSDERALAKFEKAAGRVGLEPEFIEKEDYGRLAEFDALFIRETTRVNHHTYRFARRGVAEGLVVIDDPVSIVRCTNKVYLTELMTRHRIPIPTTQLIHRDNLGNLGKFIPLPCVLKQPDSSFSQGVVKVMDARALEEQAELMLEKSELVVAQEYIPTDFDWRVGIINREPIYVCRYYMARGHWQILKHETNGETVAGRADTMSVEAAPRKVVQTAVKAANLIGDGLYGVDLKQVGPKCYLIEINDNPSIEAGVEDKVIKDELYERIMRVFLRRIERSKEEAGRR
jgi:glutathione synthase/RimK-type ligase-like ATP-grasp enzyme